ncbi:MAG TPA: site-2 protease family protein [Pirellulales bacterium]|jgi:Zn-dependent protease|nr:site-2 protease family protein [Pirellulales bacterium]
MRDLASWSINLGRWRGVHVRIHAFFVGLAVLALYLSSRHPHEGLLHDSVLLLGILLASVLLHEIAHAVMAMRLGGHTDQIVVWPLGGLAAPQIPREPQIEIAVALAGPLVNLAICFMAALLILSHGHEHELVGLWRPFDPHGLHSGGTLIVALKLTFWLNWLLVLVNLIPAFPLDGGRVLRSLLRRWLDYRAAGQMVTWMGKLLAVVLCIVACLRWEESSTALLPTWVAYIFLAMILFFSAKQEMARLDESELEDELFNYDFSQGYTSLERHFDRPRRESGPGTLRRWIAHRQEARLRKQRMIEEEEERRVDEILVRLHEAGMTGLSSKDRALLDRVSARYRNRQGS